VDIERGEIRVVHYPVMSKNDRYELMLEPTETWTVWDTVNEEPAVFAEHILGGLTESEAKAACEVMNDAWRRLRKKREAAA
jgi:hypothetical protein